MNIRIATLACIIAGALPVCASAQRPRAIADSAWTRGDRSLARTQYERGLAADENDAVALFRLALLAGWAGDHELSIAYLDRLIRQHPDDRDARTARARSVAALGDLAAAIAAVDSILVDHPSDGGAVEARARFAAWERDFRFSEQLWRRALELDEQSVGARVGLSQILRWQGRLLEARAMIRPVGPDSDDLDVRNEYDTVERLFRPRVSSAVTVEDDSDGNSVATVTGGGAFRVVDRIDARAGGYYRSAALDASSAAVSARGVNAGVVADLPSGWSLSASAGASATSIIGSTTRAALAAGVTTPRHNAAIVTLSASRSSIDYTLPLIRNDVSVTAATATVDARAGRDWTVMLEAGLAAFDIRSTGESNRRLSGRALLNRRLSAPLSLILSVRGFGFDSDLNGGYFDPDFYGLADAGIAWHRESTGWMIDAEVAPGLQQIGASGTPAGAIRAQAAATWVVRPGRQISARAVLANTGLQQVATEAAGGYRYASMSVTASWWF